MRRDHSAFDEQRDPPMYKALLIAASLAVFSLVTACSDDSEPEAEKAAVTEQAAEPAADSSSGNPKIAVSADKTHAVQPGDEITVSVTVSGFRLDPDRIGQANEPGVGHYRVYLNRTGGDDFLAEGAGPNVKITLPADITDGSHELIVALYNNDKTPVSPPVDAGVLLIVYRL